MEELARFLNAMAVRHPQIADVIDLELVEKTFASRRATAAKNKAALPTATVFTKRKIERLRAGYDGAMMSYESATEMVRHLANQQGRIVTSNLIELLTASAGDLQVAAEAT